MGVVTRAKIRLLAVIDHLGGGGAERQFLELVKRIDPDRFEVRVFLTAGSGIRLAEAEYAGIRVSCPLAGTKRRTLHVLPLLYTEIRTYRPDVIMAWLSYSITLTAAAAFAAGHRGLLFSERSSLEYLFNKEVRLGSVKKAIFKRAFRRAPIVVTNSRVVAREFAEQGYARAERIRVIQNGLDLARLDALPDKAALRKALGLDSATVYGVFVGKIEERKGIADLAEALEGVSCPALEFLVIGEGSREALVRGRRRITLLGYRSNAIEFIKAADFLVLPSHYEGLPNVVLEAMGLGTAVISTRVSGVPEIVEDGLSGLLVPPGEPGLLRDAIESLCATPSLRDKFARNARASVESLRMERMVGEFESLMVEVSGRH